MFTTGQFVRAAAFALEQGRRIPEDLMFNVFEKVADEVFPSLAQDRTAARGDNRQQQPPCRLRSVPVRLCRLGAGRP